MDSGIVLAAFGYWVLAAFGGGELLADLLSFFSIWLALCNDDIESEHADNRRTRGGWRESM